MREGGKKGNSIIEEQTRYAVDKTGRLFRSILVSLLLLR